MTCRLLIVGLILGCIPLCSSGTWGFFAHKEINKHAIFLLPEGLFPFYKHNLEALLKLSVLPDQRRYVIEGEDIRHYIDLDQYPEIAQSYPACLYVSKDSTQGIAPWNISDMCHKLTWAFREKKYELIIKYSAELGHYLSDIHVPLHTTSNYNGQLTKQTGIHGLWESRLPELFLEEYDLFLPQAYYVNDIDSLAWNTIIESHQCLDSVFQLEKEATKEIGEHRKYGFYNRNGINTHGYSKKYAAQYHQLLQGQVSRRLRCAVQCISSLWYTCWVNAGSPSLTPLVIHPASTLEALMDSVSFEVGRQHEH
ncbi:zinc dependent phospholipase C family protein [Algivirga pacifica]|uniref:S1/P1 Nuclease n=1 Tax=Algivirga pacifica TaxID=1162670 RepID=A0ABP9D3Q4_9BACT